MNVRWQKELSVAREAASEAGRVLLARFGQANRVTKKGEIDIVTEADIESEKTILDILTQRFPKDSILTEEGGEYPRLPERVWLIDPLDGTVNFAHSFPFFSVSIALEWEGDLVLGVVFNPLMGELFEATRGSGAFLNERPIHVSRTRKLIESLLATGFPYYVHENPGRVMDHFSRLVTLAQGIRRPGSAALDLCYVACGRADGYWEEGLKPWDSAAGSVIVSEAGGRVTTFEGNVHTPYCGTIVASNALIHEAVLAALNDRKG